MRILVESYNGARIFKDRSLYGIPRYVVDDGKSIRIFNKVWYSLDQVRSILDKESN